MSYKHNIIYEIAYKDYYITWFILVNIRYEHAKLKVVKEIKNRGSGKWDFGLGTIRIYKNIAYNYDGYKISEISDIHKNPEYFL